MCFVLTCGPVLSVNLGMLETDTYEMASDLTCVCQGFLEVEKVVSVTASAWCYNELTCF